MAYSWVFRGEGGWTLSDNRVLSFCVHCGPWFYGLNKEILYKQLIDAKKMNNLYALCLGIFHSAIQPVWLFCCDQLNLGDGSNYNWYYTTTGHVCSQVWSFFGAFPQLNFLALDHQSYVNFLKKKSISSPLNPTGPYPYGVLSLRISLSSLPYLR